VLNGSLDLSQCDRRRMSGQASQCAATLRYF
jgi:hypothetical protein